MAYLRPKNLRQGLILIVFVALLPVVLVSIFQGISTLNNTRALATSQLNATAKAIAERNRAPFIIARHLLFTVAANPDARDMTPRCNEALARVSQNYPSIVNFVRSDAKGAVKCSVLPFAPGTSLASEKWWQKGIKSDDVTISAPVIGRISRRPMLALMVPVRNDAGGQDGAISTGIDIDYLNIAVKASPENSRGSIAIVTSDGRTVASSDRQLGFVPNIKIKTGTAGNAETTDGNKWIYAVAPLYGPNLHVVYAEHSDPLLGLAVAQTQASILFPIGSVLLASLAIWFGTHRLVVRWLRDLGKIVGRFAQNDFVGDRAHFDQAPMEIAELSTGLHSMAESIDKQNRALKNALDANIELTREVHHRVKNNLQIITSLLTLQAGRISEPAAQQALGQTRARISALALIHRLLYQQDPESESERGKVAIANLLDELCIQIRSANRDNRGIKLHCESSAHSITADQAVPLALFAVEALTNAYRHAFTDRGTGTVVLTFRHASNSGILTIEDDGEGFQIDDDVGQMGRELMNAFASQLSGSVNIKSQTKSGSTVTLTFPALAVLHG